MKLETAVFEKDPVSFHYTRSALTYNRSLEDGTLQHSSVAEEATHFRRMTPSPEEVLI